MYDQSIGAALAELASMPKRPGTIRSLHLSDDSGRTRAVLTSAEEFQMIVNQAHLLRSAPRSRRKLKPPPPPPTPKKVKRRLCRCGHEAGNHGWRKDSDCCVSGCACKRWSPKPSYRQRHKRVRAKR